MVTFDIFIAVVYITMKSTWQHTIPGSHMSSAEQIESQIQEEICKLTKKPQTSEQWQSDMRIVYDVTADKQLYQEKHHHVRQRKYQQVDEASIISMQKYYTHAHTHTHTHKHNIRIYTI